MFKHLFMNKMKILLKNKAMLFWSLIFPFVLGTFFQLALGNVGEAFEMEVIPVAVVDNQYYQEDKILKEVISSLSKENENQLFNTVYVDESEAQKLLDNEEIDGYILLKEDSRNPVILAINKFLTTSTFYNACFVVKIIIYDNEDDYQASVKLIIELTSLRGLISTDSQVIVDGVCDARVVNKTIEKVERNPLVK